MDLEFRPPPPLILPDTDVEKNSNRTLRISDLLEWMDQKYLIDCFYNTRLTHFMDVVRNKQTGQSEGYGLIECDSHADAENILKTYNGTPMPKCGQPFRLSWATSNGEPERCHDDPNPDSEGHLTSDKKRPIEDDHLTSNKKMRLEDEKLYVHDTLERMLHTCDDTTRAIIERMLKTYPRSKCRQLEAFERTRTSFFRAADVERMQQTMQNTCGNPIPHGNPKPYGNPKPHGNPTPHGIPIFRYWQRGKDHSTSDQKKPYVDDGKPSLYSVMLSHSWHKGLFNPDSPIEEVEKEIQKRYLEGIAEDGFRLEYYTSCFTSFKVPLTTSQAKELKSAPGVTIVKRDDDIGQLYWS